MRKKINFKNGIIFNQDCLDALNRVEDGSVDLIFADPPFNLNKFYNANVNDNLSENEYLEWCYAWLELSVQKLKNGGSFYLWNIPKWNTHFAAFLNSKLSFKNWIAVDFKASMPIKGKLYPAHYSLLYYVKGKKPNSFFPDRKAIETCGNCYKDLKDYGGYKSKLNSKGISLSDIWYDIHPVRHSKYKNRSANELPLKLLDRIIQTSSQEGDLVLDIFSGSGTAVVACELKNRNWIGIEIGDIQVIKDRLKNISIEAKLLHAIRKNYNSLFTEDIKALRESMGIWVNDN